MEILNINGCKVIYHYLPSKLTNIQFMTNIGSSAEVKDNFGIAHILEHCFFKGSKKRPGANQISTDANNIGGKLNAWTHIDMTCYHITVLNELFAKGFDIISDMYQHPLFPEDELKKELHPILSEFRQNEDNPGGYLGSRIIIGMVGEDIGHATIGTEQSILSATVEKLKSFRSQHYGGKNTMISITGGITLEEVIKVVSENFFPPAATEEYKIKKAVYQSGELLLEKSGITESIYSLTYPALDRNHPDSTKQAMMSYVLGGNDSGMLFERIREELGMSCYGIYSSHMQFDPYSLVEISCGISPDEIKKLDTEVRDIIKQICNDKVLDSRLDRAKASIRTSIALGMESSYGYNNAISADILKGETANPVEKLLSEIEAVNSDDILQMAQLTFAVDPFIGILNPKA